MLLRPVNLPSESSHDPHPLLVKGNLLGRQGSRYHGLAQCTTPLYLHFSPRTRIRRRSPPPPPWKPLYSSSACESPYTHSPFLLFQTSPAPSPIKNSTDAIDLYGECVNACPALRSGTLEGRNGRKSFSSRCLSASNNQVNACLPPVPQLKVGNTFPPNLTGCSEDGGRGHTQEWLQSYLQNTVPVKQWLFHMLDY